MNDMNKEFIRNNRDTIGAYEEHQDRLFFTKKNDRNLYILCTDGVILVYKKSTL